MPRTASGNLIADRRFAWAAEYRAAGDHAAAADLLEQALELAPNWAVGHVALGEARAAAGDAAGAAAAFRRALDIDPADTAGAGPRLAVLTGDTPDRLPEAHVAALFDGYAGRFESHLVAALDYRGPALLMAALNQAPVRHFARALDLGCGTGLMGRAIRDRVDWLAGLDLSPAMVERAARTGVYDACHVGDALALPPGPWDLTLAADVLVYIGDLAPLCRALADAMPPDALFAFTAERHTGEGVVLQQTYRYAHSEAYLRGLAASWGFEVLRLDPLSSRREAGRDVPGWVGLLRCGASSATTAR